MKSQWLTFGDAGPAILLIHGFTGSTSELEELGRQLADWGYTTLLPLLPGHGTSPDDLSGVTWRHWFDTVVQAYETLRGDHDEVAVGGLSMGGTLALHLAAHFPQISAVFGMAAAIRFSTWQKAAVKSLHSLLRMRRKAQKADVRDSGALAALQSYDRYPLRAALELFRLCDHVYDDLPEIRQPALLIHSVRDNTVPVDNVHLIAERIRSSRKQVVLLQQSFHVITVDVEKKRVAAEVKAFLDAIFKHRVSADRQEVPQVTGSESSRGTSPSSSD